MTKIVVLPLPSHLYKCEGSGRIPKSPPFGKDGLVAKPSLPRDWRSKEERIKENYVPNLFLQRFSKALDLLATVVQDNGRTSFFHDRKHVLHF